MGAKSDRIKPQIPRGFRDVTATELEARIKMIQTLRSVYELHGFEPLETPAVEYVETLGKYLPEADQPDGGIFALRDDDEKWISLRYDLTAPLSRYVALNRQFLPNPFRRYQIGKVYRQEKPGPGRFREFLQCDFDTVGTASPAADAEVCIVLAAGFKALGLVQGDYRITVNNRKILNGVLETIGISSANDDDAPARLAVLRAVDKLDRLGEDGVLALLGKGRKDDSGAFTPGANLSHEDADKVMGFVRAGQGTIDRGTIIDRLGALVGDSEVGLAGVAELEAIDKLLTASALGTDQVVFDPSVVRGLAYYTGPVFEAELTFDIKDKKGRTRQFGSVAGGGRYDSLLKRFTGNDVPATGASIGLDRLIAALEAKKKIGGELRNGPVVVTIMDKDRITDYQEMVAKLRNEGICAELFLGKGGFGKQVKYADKRNSPAVVIAGGDEFAKGEVSVKDLKLGAELAKKIEDNKKWREEQPAQVTIKQADMITHIKKILER